MSTATKLTMIEAINKALHDAMEADPRVLALGEEVGDTEEGGVFGATKGLSTKFGEHRVKSTRSPSRRSSAPPSAHRLPATGPSPRSC